MNIQLAMQDTISLATERQMLLETRHLSPETGLTYQHIVDMAKRMDGELSYGKQCRWLGWAQAAVVASGVATLEDMKQINKRHSET